MKTQKFDFFNTINRRWMQTHKIPKRENRVSVFSLVEHKIEKQIDNIIKKNATLSKWMNLFSADYSSEVLQRIETKLLEYEDVKHSVDQLMWWSFQSSIAFPLKFGVGDDPKNPERVCFIIGEPGSLTLPYKTSYDDNPTMTHFRNFLTQIQGIISLKTPNFVDDVIKIEKVLSASMYDTKHVEIEKLYNKFRQPKELTFHGYFICENPKYFETFLKVIKMKEFKSYIEYLLAIGNAHFHSKLQSCVFSFVYKYLHGIQKSHTHHERTRHLLVTSVANLRVSKLYLKAHKNEAEIKMCNVIIHQLRSCLVKRLQQNQHLHKETIDLAIHKVKKIRFVVGHAREFKAGFEMSHHPKTPFDIIDEYLVFRKEEMLRTLKKGKRKQLMTTWDEGKCGNVFDVNAYYILTENAIVLPNGYLQPPFIDVSKSFAYNLGILGSTIGHEMFHSIDDEGCKYDENGHYRLWWKKEDFSIYKKFQGKVIKDYEHYAHDVDRIHIDGQMTLGENISDIGGFLLAEDALIANHFSEEVCKNFFIAYARQWRTKLSKREEINKRKTDVHSPYKYRTNLVLSYSSLFHKIFFSKERTKSFFW